MKFLILLLTAAALQATAKGHAQKITLRLTNAPLQQAFTEINKQTGYNFIYTSEQLAATHPVSLKVKDESLQQVLQLCFLDQPLTFSIEDHYIIIKEKIQNTTPSLLDIKGKVTGENGEPLVGATVAVKGTSRAVATDEKGEFILTGLNPADVLIVSNVGYQTKEIPLNGKTFVEIQLLISVGSLDETIMIAYGKTTKRLNTGSVSKVTAEEISRQPVSNPLAALEGRVPGLLVTQSNGYAGSAFKIQLRGQNSLFQGSDPLIIIDGVPFVPGNSHINQINNAAFQLSPLNLINPMDIESIEVLKDADATAIYGSRGANGVILITTKRGTAGKTKFSFRTYNGFSKVTRTMDMLNTQQYLQMRREAFANDGIIPTQSNAPDLFLFDTTRYTDFKKLFIGNTADINDVEASLSGGVATTRFLINAGYHRETTVLPTNLSNSRSSVHLNIDHNSMGNRFSINFDVSYSYDKNTLPATDITQNINLPPHLRLYNSLGKLNWTEGNTTFRSLQLKNPMATLFTHYSGDYQNLISSVQLNLRILPWMNFRSNLGYNMITGNEAKTQPSTSIDPAFASSPFSFFSTSSQKGWIAEPQLECFKMILKGKLDILAGISWQDNTSNAINISANDYTSDLLLNSVSAAGTVTTDNAFSQYRYSAIFGRINYNWEDKYLINFSGRRDGSSRFGPGRQYATLGAAGLSWIFTREKIIREKFRFLSFGKIRMSYGITGNDQIGDYQYLDTWVANSSTYQGISSLIPSRLFNPVYSWEKNKKLELALETGFFKDRILFTISYFRNRSGNQLINYSLPSQTGFNSISKNLDALIQNKGFELEMRSKNIHSGKFSWNSSITITVSRNKLLEFPGLAVSSYASTYTIGKSVNARYVYKYLGVEPSIGIYQFADVDNNGILNKVDKTKLINTDPSFYGGLRNTISLKGFLLDFIFEFKKQLGLNYLSTLGVPGYRYVNQPALVLDRWQKPGDRAEVQKFTATTTSSAYQVATNGLLNSDAVYSDASFVRCKNISITYKLSSGTLQKMKMDDVSIFFQAQNPFVITRYKGPDPENQTTTFLPPLKTFTAGCQVNF